MASQMKPVSASLCSSEYKSRIEALQLQLEHERKRRLEVLEAISAMSNDTKVPPTTAGLAEEVLRSSVMERATTSKAPSVRSQKSLSSTPPVVQVEATQQHLPSIINVAPSIGSSKKTPEDKSSGRPANGNVPNATVQPQPPSAPFVVVSASTDAKKPAVGGKPPLPPQARGLSGRKLHFGKRRTSSVDVYLTTARHEKRLEQIQRFQLPLL